MAYTIPSLSSQSERAKNTSRLFGLPAFFGFRARVFPYFSEKRKVKSGMDIYHAALQLGKYSPVYNIITIIPLVNHQHMPSLLPKAIVSDHPQMFGRLREPILVSDQL